MPEKWVERRGNSQNQAALGHILTENVQEKKSCGPVVFIFQFHICPVKIRMCHRQRNTCFYLPHYLSWQRSKLPHARLWSLALCPCDSTCPADHGGNWVRDSRAKSCVLPELPCDSGVLSGNQEMPKSTTEKCWVKVMNTLGLARTGLGKCHWWCMTA